MICHFKVHKQDEIIRTFYSLNQVMLYVKFTGCKIINMYKDEYGIIHVEVE